MSETVVNTYGGSPLNRLSWLRTSHAFLNAVVALPSTRWMLLNYGQPLIIKSDAGDQSFKYLTTQEVKPFLGPEPYFGQGQNPGELVPDAVEGEHNRHSPTLAVRHRGAPIVFLGLHETEPHDANSALPSSEFTNPEIAIQKLNGTAYFAMDIAELGLPETEVKQILDGALLGNGRSYSWVEPRSLMSSMDSFTAAVFANARSMVDWNFRNKFCPGCGSPTYSMWAGWKIACTSLLPWTDNTGRKPCPSGKGLHNYTHPRTDPVVIMIAIDETGDKRRFPGKFYSALAGFIEPGESFEDSVAREMWEEAGVHVWNVKYHSGQPWPYPASLMVGFYARADSSKPIRVDLDNELADARWFTRDEVRAVLDHKAGTTFRKSDFKRMNEIVEGKATEDKTNAEMAAQALSPADPGAASKPVLQREPTDDDEPPFRLPPLTAIAGVLIRDWVDGKIGFKNELLKGNL
ncbi:NAD+ diphosphatase [Ephemerocybe angulata]|uniref:NAD(+) diphosphatase n=1 Tax=Ephemerocybe angulata TaxID=980116 RepID=A0A8H6MEN3_9AGAR|nr:NAD+ diphosphatase [Tulosesus angulatus]